ncbi:hypothetical protein ANABIO32_26090 [Rossellomorea marisflavi]|nr:hypothetical protein ANABIO32_26090 [Rossellomorea marisflavi]
MLSIDNRKFVEPAIVHRSDPPEGQKRTFVRLLMVKFRLIVVKWEETNGQCKGWV